MNSLIGVALLTVFKVSLSVFLKNIVCCCWLMHQINDIVLRLKSFWDFSRKLWLMSSFSKGPFDVVELSERRDLMKRVRTRAVGIRHSGHSFCVIQFPRQIWKKINLKKVQMKRVLLCERISTGEHTLRATVFEAATLQCDHFRSSPRASSD